MHGKTKYDRIEGVEKFWHGLNEVKDKIVFEGGALDWAVREEPVFDADMNPVIEYVPKGENLEERPFKQIVTDVQNQETGETDKLTLAVPRQTYEMIQNKQLFDAVRPLIDEYGFRVVSMGSVMARKKVFFCLESDESFFEVKGDKNIIRINALSSHDGSMKFGLVESDIRTVCYNTFRWNFDTLKRLAKEAKASAKEMMQFFAVGKHTKNADVKLANIKDGLVGYVQRRELVKDTLETMTGKATPESEAQAFLAGLLGGDEKLSTRANGQVSEIVNLYKSGIGNKGETRYDLFNGITEYYTHRAKGDAGKMFISSEFGSYATRKETAFAVLSSESEYNKTCEKGQALLAEA